MHPHNRKSTLDAAIFYLRNGRSLSWLALHARCWVNAPRTTEGRGPGVGPRAPPPFVSLTDWPVHIRGAWGWSPRFPTPAEFLKASHWFTQLVAAWRTTPFPCNALLAPRVLDMSRAWHADRARSCWRAQPVELKGYEGCGSDANRGARGGPGANNMALQ